MARAGVSAPRTAPKTHAAIEQRHKKELEQVHIVLGVPSYPLAHERRYAAALLNSEWRYARGSVAWKGREIPVSRDS